MCRSGYEIYDLAWSPDAVYFIIGSIDNVARIYNAERGMLSESLLSLLTYARPDDTSNC